MSFVFHVLAVLHVVHRLFRLFAMNIYLLNASYRLYNKTIKYFRNQISDGFRLFGMLIPALAYESLMKLVEG